MRTTKFWSVLLYFKPNDGTYLFLIPSLSFFPGPHTYAYPGEHLVTMAQKGGDGKGKKEEDTSDFVSAVSWRTGTNVIAAANSQGMIKVSVQRVLLLLKPAL